MNLHEFLDAIWKLGFRSVYLSHYEDVAEARRIASQMTQHGFKVTMAEDARRLGKDFVSKCIGNCDLTLVISPDSSATQLLLQHGNKVVVIEQ